MVFTFFKKHFSGFSFLFQLYKMLFPRPKSNTLGAWWN